MKTIPLSQGKVAFVDDDLFDELNSVKWLAYRNRKTFYAARSIRLPNGRQTTIKMHREVFRLRGESVPKLVDHKDRDGLNNRRNNLRPATQSQQNYNQDKRINNTSGYIGVYRHRSKWQALVGVGGKKVCLGSFSDPFSAAWVRDAFVKQLDLNAVTNRLVDRRRAERRKA